MFSAYGKNGLGWPQIWLGGFLFLLIRTVPTFRAEQILILRMFVFGLLGPPISGFPGPQISKFPDFQVSSFPDAAGATGRTLRTQPDPSPVIPKDQTRRTEPEALVAVSNISWLHPARIPISTPRVDSYHSSKGSHRVNRAHWPTKENRHFEK